MASFLRRQDDLQNLKVRNLYLQNTNGTYPADESILTISGNRGLVVTSSGITVSSLDTCELTAADGKFVVDCTTGWLDMYRPGLTAGTFGTYASSGIQLHGGITGGTTASQYLYRMYIQAEPNDISGAGVPMSSTVGVLGIADASGRFEAPVLLFDGSANKMRVIQFGTPVGNIASVTIDQNYSPNLEPHPLNVAQHCGRVSTQQLQVAGYMGVNIYNNDNGFQPLQPVGITSEFGGAGLRNNPTSYAYPYSGTAITNRYPTVITSWKPTTAGITGKNFNLITMDVSAGYIGILKNNPTEALDVFGNINQGSLSTGTNYIALDAANNPFISTAVKATGGSQAYHEVVAQPAGNTLYRLRNYVQTDGNAYIFHQQGVSGVPTTLQLIHMDTSGQYIRFQMPNSGGLNTYIQNVGTKSPSFVTSDTAGNTTVTPISPSATTTLTTIVGADFPPNTPATRRYNIVFQDAGTYVFPTYVDVSCFFSGSTLDAQISNAGILPAGWSFGLSAADLTITTTAAPIPVGGTFTALLNYITFGAQ